MENSKAGVNLVLLDACRNNPFARSFRSVSRGLARVQAPSGTLIHYAPRPGSIAEDCEGANSAYTEALRADRRAGRCHRTGLEAGDDPRPQPHQGPP